MNEISKKLMCVQMRSGIEIWVEDEKAKKLQDILGAINQSKFIRFEEQTFNTADIVGVFSANVVADLTRRKNGQWQCAHNTWHDKGEKCACVPAKDRKAIEDRLEKIKACGRCRNGFLVLQDGSATICDCQK